MTFDQWFLKLLTVNSTRGEYGTQYPLGSCCYRDVIRDPKVKAEMRRAWKELGLDGGCEDGP